MTALEVYMLADRIYNAKIEYYTKGESELEDWEYDQLEMRLEKHCPNHPIVGRVGYDISGDWVMPTVEEIQKLLGNK